MRRYLTLLMAVLMSSAGCGGRVGGDRGVELRRFPLDSTTGLISMDGVSLDSSITSDGGGSIKITRSMPGTIQLYQTGGIDIEEAFLVYEAKLRTESFEGEAYLEMWCSFPGKGEYYSRGLDDKVSGTTDWKTVSTEFRCLKGQNPDIIKLNLVAYGKGTVWIDDIRLLSKELE
jgi:hypothetical protein